MESDKRDLKIPEKVASMLIQGYCLVTDSCPECKGLLVRSKSNELICVKCFCERANERRSTKHGLSDDEDECKEKPKGESVHEEPSSSKLMKLELKENSGQSNQSTITRERLEEFYRDFYRDLQQLNPRHNSRDIVKYFDSDEKRKEP